MGSAEDLRVSPLYSMLSRNIVSEQKDIVFSFIFDIAIIWMSISIVDVYERIDKIMELKIFEICVCVVI